MVNDDVGNGDEENGSVANEDTKMDISEPAKK